jgi:hypothetical protein
VQRGRGLPANSVELPGVRRASRVQALLLVSICADFDEAGRHWRGRGVEGSRRRERVGGGSRDQRSMASARPRTSPTKG